MKSTTDNLLKKDQTRREFFKTVSKIAVPAIAFLGFGSAGRELFAFGKKYKFKNSSDCKGTCTGTCESDCAGGCGFSCDVSCSGNCEGSCESACTGNCEGLNGKSSAKSVYESEESGCDCSGCTGSCLGPCKGDCFSGCVESCARGCGNQCSQSCGFVNQSSCGIRG